jgi:hypothetical protein
MAKKVLFTILLIVVAGFGLIQLVPYGHDHTNPPVVQEPAWNNTETRTLAQRACFDCHSNETVWPWYSNIAPVSWLVQRDVEEGRRRLNFSEWGRRREEVDEFAETIQEGEMPPPYFVMLHPSANLSSQEKNALINGLFASLGAQSGAISQQGNGD